MCIITRSEKTRINPTTIFSSSRAKQLNQTHVENAITPPIIYQVFLASCFVNLLIVVNINEPLFDHPFMILRSTKLLNSSKIYFALTINLSIYFPILLDLLLDWKSNKDLTLQDDQVDAQHNILFEKPLRLLLILHLACLILLVLCEDENVARMLLFSA